MWISYLVMVLAVLVLVCSIFAGGIFTIIFLPLAAVALLVSAGSLAWVRRDDPVEETPPPPVPDAPDTRPAEARPAKDARPATGADHEPHRAGPATP